VVFYAHSQNEAGVRHDLVKHLLDVAVQARTYAKKLGAGDLGYYAGLWHDLGKFHSAFQRYLLECEVAPGSRHRGPDHKRAGASLAAQHLPPLALLVQGHHGGLGDSKDLRAWLQEATSREAIAASLQLARATFGTSLESVGATATTGWPEWANLPREAELLLRFLFSALVDADCLDTERHFNPDRTDVRIGAPTLAELDTQLTADQDRLLHDAPDTPVNRVRREVYESCLSAAELPPGLFRLTVPTGGGKTRSGLAFALHHALIHNLDRVVVAIPYTSIIEQTADVYQAIFGDERSVLEHHSGVNFVEPGDDAPVTPDALWARLASENWDAPIVVTTNVQLFESRSSRGQHCERLASHPARRPGED
jgi:CRISPR-associated endonuclease/helicase Cas3